jgi:hypothetical protein
LLDAAGGLLVTPLPPLFTERRGREILRTSP